MSHIYPYGRAKLEVQGILRKEGLEGLSRLSVEVKRHREHPNLVHLSYHQFESPMELEAVRECRGLILDEDDDWSIVCYPFKKFFNAREKHAAEINWKTARAWEKVDGSLMTLYYYKGKWYVSTTGTPDADCPLQKTDLTYREKFNELLFQQLRAARLKIEDVFFPDHCYMFELVGPDNRIVVRYPEWKLYLLGVRKLFDLSEWFFFHGHGIGGTFDMPEIFYFSSLEEAENAAAALDPMGCEGFVVCDSSFNRLKIKSPRYVELHHLKSELTPRRLLEVIRRGESSEFLTYFPEWSPEFSRMEAVYNVLVDQIDRDFFRLKHIEDRKVFAQTVEHFNNKHALFALKSGKATSGRDWFRQLTPPAAERAFETLSGRASCD